MLPNLGKILIWAGLILIVMGAIFLFSGKIPYFGKLPGDIVVQKKNFTLFFPVTTMILLSVLLSLCLFFISRIFHR